MLIKNKTFSFFYSALICFLFSFNFNAVANHTLLSNEKLITEVEILLEQHVEALNYQQVVKLSNKVINLRSNFPNDIIAKTYLLLGHVTINNGELEAALQFTYDGLSIMTQNRTVRVPLQMNLIRIFYARKQYQKILDTVQETIDSPQSKKNTRCFLTALSYRSVAFSMLGLHSKALKDLQQVETVIQQNPSFAEHISLLSIFANAYYYLGDYQTAITLQLKVLKLRFNLNRLNNIDQTYFHLANAHYRLNKFDDAYNAYWEAKRYAQKKNSPIYVAYASQGLSLTLLRQKEYQQAKNEAIQAKDLFYENNLASSHLESIIALSQIYRALQKQEQSFNLLLKAEKLIKNITITDDYILLYKHLAEMYLIKKEFQKAYVWQSKYSEAILKQHSITNKPNAFDSDFFSNEQVEITENPPASSKSRELAIKLADQSELSASFSHKFHIQQLIILITTTIIFLLLFVIIIVWIKQRRNKLQSEYETLEKPNYILPSAIETKELYQINFNMARKYDYSLTLGYISITNWQELTFQFNKKTVSEVSKSIARIINEQLGEFENAGLVNNGEYLLSFPHQNKEDVTNTIEKLVSALKSRFFANLGDFSVIVAYSIESPDFQDIDPYIFLSQLSGSIKFGE